MKTAGYIQIIAGRILEAGPRWPKEELLLSQMAIAMKPQKPWPEEEDGIEKRFLLL